MDEINFAQYASASQRFLALSALHSMSERAKSRNSPWLLVETAFSSSLTVDLGWSLSTQ